MGNSLCCGLSGYERFQREEHVKEGDVFERHTTLFGLLPTVERIHLRVNAAGTRLEWTQADEPSEVARTEAIHLAHIAKILPSGKADMIVFAISGKTLLHVTSKQPDVRDLWVQTLYELLDVHGSKFTNAELESVAVQVEKQKAKEKEVYWQERTATLMKRQVHANEKKRAFANVGMRYTAEAMAKR
ncbi:hypothetical protein LEN26_005990 [Aphanomyces euteiches]|nr:hypothetical protein AeMF1_010581 [Aphanomyces euteiches]KAH9136861.1 hypothetical protein LEN26_005990 [Aphanomyces euteiches]